MLVEERSLTSGAFLVTWAVSLMTQAPSKEMQEFVDSIRVPKGDLAWVRDTHHD